MRARGGRGRRSRFTLLPPSISIAWSAVSVSRSSRSVSASIRATSSGDVAVADDDRALAAEVELLLGVVGVGVVPADEGRGGVAAGQVLARDAEPAVGLAAEGEDDRVVEALEVLDLDVVSDLDVAEKAEAVACRGLLVDPDHRLDLGVVRGDAAPDQAERGGEAVEEVHLGVRLGVLEDVLGGVEAGGAGADDRHAERVLSCPGSAHCERGRIGNGGPGAVRRSVRARRRPQASRRARRGPCRRSSRCR